MKTSLSHLPDSVQTELKRITELILKNLPAVEFIILYGSYARGNYVECEERNEFGIRTTFMSDYDILVVTSGMDPHQVEHILDDIDANYYKYPERQIPLQFINDDIDKLNSDLSERRYFYTGVRKDGIVLYDSGNYKLKRARKLGCDEIRKQAGEYFKDKFDRGDSFLRSAGYDYADRDYQMGLFHLHQACENYFSALRLVHTLKSSKQHDLGKLLAGARKYSSDLQSVFSRTTEEETRLFELLKSAYVEARYNPRFLVTRPDFDALLPKVMKLRETIETACKKRLEKCIDMQEESYKL